MISFTLLVSFLVIFALFIQIIDGNLRCRVIIHKLHGGHFLWTEIDTGGSPLTRKSLTRFPLTRFLAYVRVSGEISVSRGPQYSFNS